MSIIARISKSNTRIMFSCHITAVFLVFRRICSRRSFTFYVEKFFFRIKDILSITLYHVYSVVINVHKNWKQNLRSIWFRVISIKVMFLLLRTVHIVTPVNESYSSGWNATFHTLWNTVSCTLTKLISEGTFME